jgi:hypothetical protein
MDPLIHFQTSQQIYLLGHSSQQTTTLMLLTLADAEMLQ